MPTMGRGRNGRIPEIMAKRDGRLARERSRNGKGGGTVICDRKMI
jgi:hypothetical protein